MPAWLAPAIYAAGSIASTAIAKGKGERQLSQQSKLNELQIQANNQMLGIQAAKEYDMWKKTGPAGQIEEYKKAGLNPALMYGMGGGGGQTMGGSANVSAPQAPGGSGNEPESILGIASEAAMKLAMMKSTKENLDADTAKKKAEAAKTAGIDTEVGEAQIKSLTAGIASETAKQGLMAVETKLKELETKYMNESMGDRLQKISGEAVQAVQAGQQAVNETSISDATRTDKIKQIKAEAIGAVLRNALTGAQTRSTEAGTNNIQAETRLKGQEYEQNIQKLMIEWKELSVRERQHELNRMLGIGQDDPVNSTMRMVTEALDDIIMFRTGTATKPGHTPIKGFGGR